ncbi:hypothetical protein D3C77_209020 [compost metagenome]
MRTFIQAHGFVGIERQAIGGGAEQIQGNHQQPGRREFDPRLDHHQPVGAALRCQLIDRLGSSVSVHHFDLQIAVKQSIGGQAGERALQQLGAAAIIDHQHGKAWRRVGGQALDHQRKLLRVRITRLQPVVHGQMLGACLVPCGCLGFFDKHIQLPPEWCRHFNVALKCALDCQARMVHGIGLIKHGKAGATAYKAGVQELLVDPVAWHEYHRAAAQQRHHTGH